MLKTGIYGADTRQAGELLRLLVNHPDVDIQQLFAPSHKGESVSTYHHGLLGERELKFTERIDPAKLDVLFLCISDPYTEGLLNSEKENEATEIESQDRKRPLRIIEMSGRHIKDYKEAGLEYGLSEINRKALVRGARRGVVPSAESSLTLASLYPIASHLLLTGNLLLEFELPDSYLKETDPEGYCQDIAKQLATIQTSFNGDVSCSVRKTVNTRAMRMRVSIPCSLSKEEVSKIYDSIYDDHNFTWTVDGEPDIREVEGTQKCIIGLTKENPGRLTIEGVADCRMRGGAGDGVHLMNLLCGLHERTGLRMKAVAY